LSKDQSTVSRDFLRLVSAMGMVRVKLKRNCPRFCVDTATWKSASLY